MKRLIPKLLFLLAAAGILMLLPAALAEPAITFTPEHPRMGDYVDVTVTPDREGAQSIAWSLATPDETVFSGKETDHFTASFRPRLEAEYTLTVTVSYGKKDTETAGIVIPVSGAAPVQEGPDVVYSQKDGWWHDKIYSAKHHRSVEKAGCALFALSHALQRMGFTGEEVQPDRLAERYKYCYVEGRGTANEILTGDAAETWGFSTMAELIETEEGLRTCFLLGDRFTFSIVNGHIAYADALSEDGAKVHVVDSAPGATYERIKNGSIYYRDETGAYREAKTPEELPGIRWFFETGEYGGMEYWMDLDYCARRGMRMIRPRWLTLATPDGDVPAELVDVGAVRSTVTVDGEPRLVPTGQLTWITADEMKIARIARKNTPLNNDSGKRVPGVKLLQPGAMVAVIASLDKQLYVWYKGAFGYVPAANAELLAFDQTDYPTALVSVSGKTSGSLQADVRTEPGKGQSFYKWPVGTPVTVLEQKGDYYYLEGAGVRGWLKYTQVALDDVPPDESAEGD